MPLSAKDPDTEPLAPRTLDRSTRRSQVIEATIECLAERGFSRTTVTDVARRAGISHGLVLFHFQSKDNPLAEVLDFLADEYQSNWQETLATASDAPEAQIIAKDASIRTQAMPNPLTKRKGDGLPSASNGV